MTSGPNHETRLDELIALAAMGELSPAESDELDQLLAHDAAVVTELTDALDTAAALQAGHAEVPPAELRERVIAAAASTPQEPPHERDHDPSPVIDRAPVASLDATRERRRTPFLAAAAAVVLVIAGVIGVLAFAGGGDDEFAAVLEADDATRRVLEGELAGELTVTHSASVDAIAVEGEALDPVDVDRTLELWLIDDAGAAVSIGRFRPDDDGDVRVRIDDVDPTGATLGVTEEPAGGSPAPTPPVLAVG